MTTQELCACGRFADGLCAGGCGNFLCENCSRLFWRDRPSTSGLRQSQVLAQSNAIEGLRGKFICATCASDRVRSATEAAKPALPNNALLRAAMYKQGKSFVWYADDPALRQAFESCRVDYLENGRALNIAREVLISRRSVVRLNSRDWHPEVIHTIIHEEVPSRMPVGEGEYRIVHWSKDWTDWIIRDSGELMAQRTVIIKPSSRAGKPSKNKITSWLLKSSDETFDRLMLAICESEWDLTGGMP